MLPTRNDCLLSRVAAAVAILMALDGHHAGAANGWPDERIAGPFAWHADFPLDSCRSLLDEMAWLQRDLIRTLNLHPTQETIHLFLFHREAVYRRYVAEYLPNVPYRRALFVKERGPGMVFAYRNADLAIDLRHEGTHALLHASLPMVPLWLDEGLAEYFEVPAADRAFNHPHLPSVRWGVRWGNVPAMQRLEQLRDLQEMGQTEYRHAWAWVHFLVHGPADARDEFLRYLGDIQGHTPPGTLSERLARRVPDLDREFADHFRRWRQ